MGDVITHVGIDAHKKDLQVAMLVGHARTPETWTVANERRAIERLVRKLEREAPGPVQCCYEAGPCGYALQRQLQRGRVTCQVIAPALVPRKAGERIKTDRRDARKLAELLRAGLLTEVRPPTPAEEAARDLVRARDDAREDLQRCRHRLGKLLLRRGQHYTGRNWTKAHGAWLKTLTWEHAAEQQVVEDYLLAIDQVQARLTDLDTHLAELASTAPYAEPVAWLRCFRGIDTLTAMTIVAELHDFRRFVTARALMAYLGLVPSEHSSGGQTSRGRITKTGNALVRRVLTEAAWHYQHRPGIGRMLKQRREGQPPRVIAIADKAQHRLCRRFRRLTAEHKPAPKVAVAIARELAGFLWATLQVPHPVSRTSSGTMINGPRSRRMALGTIQRTRELDMRQGLAPGLAPLDCTSSRRSTVMRALPRLAEVITGYQRDSSSKRPRSSAVFAARPPTLAYARCRRRGRVDRRPPRLGNRTHSTGAIPTAFTGPFDKRSFHISLGACPSNGKTADFRDRGVRFS